MMLENVILTFDYVPAKDCVLLMHSRTDESGTLIMPGWYDNIDTPEYWFKLKLNWTEEDAGALVGEFHDLRAKMEALAAAKDYGGIEGVIAGLGEMKTEHPMLRGAQRLYKLLEIGAPPCVIDREAGWLAQVFAVCRFAESFEKFDTVEQALGL